MDQVGPCASARKGTLEKYTWSCPDVVDILNIQY